MTPILSYLTMDVLPADSTKAKFKQRQTTYYTIHNGEVFTRGFACPLLKYLDKEHAHYVLAKMHWGICGMHSGARCIGYTVLRV